MFGWLKRRERRDFTVTTTDRAVAAAFGNTDTADVTATAAATAAMGITGRAFAAAAVMPSVERTGLTPETLACIGAAFVTAGESVWMITVENGRVRLYRAASWDIEGGPFEQRYRLTIPGPTRQVDRVVPSEGVFHHASTVRPSHRSAAGVRCSLPDSARRLSPMPSASSRRNCLEALDVSSPHRSTSLELRTRKATTRLMPWKRVSRTSRARAHSCRPCRAPGKTRKEGTSVTGRVGASVRIRPRPWSN